MSPSFSACAWRILKISSCLRSPPTLWTLSSRAMALRSEIDFSLSSDRFIPLDGSCGSCCVGFACPRSRRALINGLRARRSAPHGVRVLRFSAGFLRGWSYNAAIVASRGPCCQRFSHTNLDDRALLDLLEPGLQPGFVLLPEQDFADLLFDSDQPVALQRVLRLEPEDVVTERRPVRGRHLAGLQLQDLGLDVLRELSALEAAEVATVFRARVLRMGSRDGREIPGFEHLLAQDVRADPGALPGRVVGALRHDENVPRVVRQAGLELLPVFFHVLNDLRIRDRDTQRNFATDHLLHA